MNVLLFPMLQINIGLYYNKTKRNEKLEGTSWHGYQLAEQIVKIDAGTTWQSVGTTWGQKNRVRLAPGMTLRGYDLTNVVFVTSAFA